MLSRVADSLYWIGRYVERAEHLVRLLDDAFQIELEAGSTSSDGNSPLDTVLKLLNARKAYDRWCRGLSEPAKGGSPETILRFLTFARTEGVSVRSMISLARENARGTQDALAAEVWSQLNQTYLYLSSGKALANFHTSALRFYGRVRRECLLFAALVREVMPRTEAYHFIQLGRHLERIDLTCRVLAVHCRTANHDPENSDLFRWRGLLRSCAAYEAYLQQSGTYLDERGVIEYILLATDSPRSVRYGTGRCLESLRYIGGSERVHGGNEAERQLGRLESDLRYADIDEILQTDVTPFLDHVLSITGTASSELQIGFFRV